MIHGEAFEENIDIDFLNLPVGDYVKVYVILDEMKRPHFLSAANAYTRPAWNNLSEKYDFNSKDIYALVNPEMRQMPTAELSVLLTIRVSLMKWVWICRPNWKRIIPVTN